LPRSWSIFKQDNESLGHDTGDELLKLVAGRIRSATRALDVVIRLGGDDFVIVQTGEPQPAGAEKLAARLVELLARPFLAAGEQINVGASVGIAIVGYGTDTSDELLTHANLALREAKSHGRGLYRFFAPDLAQRARARFELEVDLRRALPLKELSLFYQPQLRLADKRICGFEALMRWSHPLRGWVSPAEFIPLAEKIGEIHAIGAWALRTACRDAMQWPSHYGVAVNVSPIQFANDDLVEAVRGALAESGLPAERLEVEITEGVLLNNTDAAMERLAAVNALGVSIAMDDFGTGYSSLGYLTRFPFSKIKIDQSFLRGEQTQRSRALVEGILAIGERLGMTTIAEGVETEQQLAELTAHGCSQAQGYLISRPLTLDATMKFIAAHETHLTGAPVDDAIE
jgi:diguanylate cyclase (GGDEF)-like protein